MARSWGQSHPAEREGATIKIVSVEQTETVDERHDVQVLDNDLEANQGNKANKANPKELCHLNKRRFNGFQLSQPRDSNFLMLKENDRKVGLLLSPFVIEAII